MNVRKIGAGVAAAAATCALALSALAPANADTAGYGANGTTKPVLGTDLIATGSDTTQWVLDALSSDYNSTVAGTGPKVISYSACLGNAAATANLNNPDGTGFPCGNDNKGTIGKRDESVVDPSFAGNALAAGSGDGRAALRTPTDPIAKYAAFARSSGPVSSGDYSSYGLTGIPFAVDKLVVAVNPKGPAPAALTGEQVLGIYSGLYTNWKQVGGKNAPIHAYMPKNGSGTQQVFKSYLAALDGVTAAPGDTTSDPTSYSAASQTWVGSTLTPAQLADTTGAWKGDKAVEEHDPSALIADKNGIEPFSLGRLEMANAGLSGVGTAKAFDNLIRAEGGWTEDRVVYNVVRTKPIDGFDTTPFVWGQDNGALEKFLGADGYMCGSAAATIIANYGMWQIKGTTPGTQCGVLDATETGYEPAAGTYAGVDEPVSTTTTAKLKGRAVTVSVAGSTVAGKAFVSAVTASGKVFTKTVALKKGKATVALGKAIKGQTTVSVSYLPNSWTTSTTSSATPVTKLVKAAPKKHKKPAKKHKK